VVRNQQNCWFSFFYSKYIMLNETTSRYCTSIANFKVCVWNHVRKTGGAGIGLDSVGVDSWGSKMVLSVIDGIKDGI
jgi:hypothetical protein